VATVEDQKSEDLCPQRVCSACRSAGVSTPCSTCGRPGAPRLPIVWGQLKTPPPLSSSFFAACDVGRKKEKQKKEIKEIFGLLDTDSADEVDSKELKVVMRTLDFEPKKQAQKMISDEDGDGLDTIGCEEFLKRMMRKNRSRDFKDQIFKTFLSLRRR